MFGVKPSDGIGISIEITEDKHGRLTWLSLNNGGLWFGTAFPPGKLNLPRNTWYDSNTVHREILCDVCRINSDLCKAY